MAEQEHRPLDGIRVVAVEHSVAGPLASRILADMGAEVAKIEAPGGDFARSWDDHVRGMSSYFVWLNRRKQGVTLDLREETDAAQLESLLGHADVLVMNTSARATARLGLDRESIEGRHPHLVVCSITGYASEGSYAHRKAYDMLLQAESGLMSVNGDAQQPSRIGVSVGDVTAGIYASTLILGALRLRDRTGRGHYIDLSMFESLLEYLAPNLVAYLNAGITFDRHGLRHHTIVPYGLFDTADAPLLVAIHQDTEWQRFARNVLEEPELADNPKYHTNPDRVRLRDEVEGAVERILVSRDRQAWVERLDKAAIAYAIPREVAEVVEHDVVSDLDLETSTALPDGGTGRVLRSPAERIFGRRDATSVPARGGRVAKVLNAWSRS